MYVAHTMLSTLVMCGHALTWSKASAFITHSKRIGKCLVYMCTSHMMLERWPCGLRTHNHGYLRGGGGGESFYWLHCFSTNCLPKITKLGGGGWALDTLFFHDIRFCNMPSIFCALTFAGLFYSVYFSSIPSSTNFLGLDFNKLFPRRLWQQPFFPYCFSPPPPRPLDI